MAYTQTKLVPKKSAVLQQMQAVTAVTVNMLTHQLLTMQKETKAPKGYELDETVYTFVNSGKKSRRRYKNL